jgi:LPS sulfotransferase NodH
MPRVDFVIVSEARTGSNLLMYAVADHPEVICYGECFSEHSNEYYRTHIDSSHRAWHLVRGGIHQEFLPEFDIDTPAQTVLEQFIYRRDYPDQIRAVGFKYQWFQGRPASPWSATRSLLGEMPDLRVIHLHRQNLLEQIASARLARATKQWVVWDEQGLPAEQPKIHLPVAVVQAFFVDQSRNLKFIAEHFRSHRYLRVSYEELVSNFAAHYEEIQQFLELTIHPVPKPRTLKQSRLRMRDAIENYAELQGAFAHTPWADFFDQDVSVVTPSVPSPSVRG